MIDITWVSDWVQVHQPHGWAMFGAVVLFVLFASFVGVCIGDAD